MLQWIVVRLSYFGAVALLSRVHLPLSCKSYHLYCLLVTALNCGRLSTLSVRLASWELAQRRRACSEKYDTATRAAPAIFFKKNSVKLTCIEGLSLSLTRSRTPKIPKRKGTLTIKPAKKVESFVFIVVGVFVVGVVRRLASLEVFRACHGFALRTLGRRLTTMG